MKNLPYLSAVLITLILAINVYTTGFTESVDRIMIRATAKMSLVLFLIAFCASALHHFINKKWTSALLKNRRYIGLSFVVSHTFHLLFILLLQFYFDAQNFEERGVATVLGGAVAYLFLYLMAITSTDKMVSRIGIKNWKRLHLLGSYYIVMVFAISYIPRAMSDSNYLPFASFIIIVLILRMTRFIFLRFDTDNRGK